MRKSCLAAGILLTLSLAAGGPAHGQLNITQFSQVNGGLKDIWGYTANAREYALCCAGNSLKIIDVTDPFSPSVVAVVPALTNDLKDVKVYQNYAYAINQFGPMQIIDLQYLPDSARTVAAYDALTYNGGHNLIIEGSYAFVTKNGASPTDLRILDLSTPTAPVEVGFFTHPDVATVFADAHDCFVRDTFCYVANLSAGWVVLSIADITSPRLLAKVTYPGNFTHSMWENQTGDYLFTTDEVADGHIRVWDVSNLSDIREVAEYISAPGRIVHNCFVDGDFLYIAYYGDGVKVVDVSNPLIPVEVGSFDTYPQGAGAFFDGCWGVYPYFASGTIVASDITNGMYALSFNGTRAGYVSGRITEAGTADPVADVTVTVLENGEQKVTGETGDYAIGAVPGTYALVFEKFAYAVDTQQVDLVAQATAVLDVVLTPLAGAALEGNVTVSGCGTALTGTAVTVAGTSLPVEITDIAGDYSVAFLPAATYDVTAARFGYLPAESTYTVTVGPPNALDFALSLGVDDDAEVDQAWMLGVPGDDATTGLWARVDPNGTQNGATAVAPEDDHSATGVACFVTGNAAPGASIGADDIDGGTTTLRSPVFSIAHMLEPELSYWRWFSNNQGSNPGSDAWVVQLSADGGNTWIDLENTTFTTAAWLERTFDLGTLVEPSTTMVLQFVASDLGGGSVVEAAVDDIRIVDAAVYGDVNDDGSITAADIIDAVNWIFKGGTAPSPVGRVDVDGNCTQNSGDIIYLVNFVFKSGPDPSAPCLCP